jgi:hypothetical protein
MDRDDFIITVYCLVCDHYRAVSTQQPIRHGGFAIKHGSRSYGTAVCLSGKRRIGGWSRPLFNSGSRW